MSSFLEDIRITDDDKKKIMTRILFTMMYSSKILSIDELLERDRLNKKKLDETVSENSIEDKLNENEILATYSLGKEIKIVIMSYSNRNRELLDYLELKADSVNSDKLLKFVNEAVKDIEDLKSNNPNATWSLQINKILSNLKKEKLDDEVLIYQYKEKPDSVVNKSTKTSNKIIRFPKEYLDDQEKA